MGLAGPSGPTEKRRAELIGGLYLVGARGKCCAVITERQITIERFDGRGVRLDLAAIERMRHLKIPMLPSGTVLLGIITIYLGITTILSPMSWLAVGLGAAVIVANIMSRYSILAIETGSGDRHLVSGSEANLLKLCLIVDRVRHGSDIQEAVLGLENLESELPTFPALRDVTGQLGQEPLAALPNTTQTDITENMGCINEPFLGIGKNSDVKMFDPPLSAEATRLEIEENDEKEAPIHYSSKQNAYERAWGVQEAPPWYKEKKTDSKEITRIDSAFSDAAEGLDMFSPGGLFDSNPISEDSETGEMGLFDFEFGRPSPAIERTNSSSQMIKRAHEEFGAPTEPFSNSLLPPPTEDAVREECKAGVVRQAKARHELRSKGVGGLEGVQAANLDDYPALKGLASTMSGSRSSGVKSKAAVSGGWLSRLLRPNSTSANRINGENTDSTNEIETERFQTTQHMRLRSDQDHQADVSSRLRAMRKINHSSTARDKLDSIVRSLSEEEDTPLPLDGPNDSLRFNQLTPTSSKEDPHPLPGLRRLG